MDGKPHEEYGALPNIYPTVVFQGTLPYQATASQALSKSTFDVKTNL